MRVISQSGSSGIQWDTSVGCLGNDGLGSTRYVARTVSACVLFLHFKTPFCTFLSIRRISNHCRKRVRVQLSKLLCCGLKTRKFAGQNRKLAANLAEYKQSSPAHNRVYWRLPNVDMRNGSFMGVRDLYASRKRIYVSDVAYWANKGLIETFCFAIYREY